MVRGWTSWFGPGQPEVVGIAVVTEVPQGPSIKGKVKWFSDQKGYGFIARDDATDVFVHHTSIVMEGFRTLKQGEDVAYELRDGAKGPQAVNVTPLPEDTSD